MGGGTAGLVVASRLASDPRNSVAVIEAGTFYEISNGNLSQIPAYVAYNALFAPNDIQPLIDWGFVTSSQPVSIPEADILCCLYDLGLMRLLRQGLNQRVIHYAQGKCLGGS